MAILSACLAIFGRCSLILMPATLVSISLKGPPLAWSGFRSNVSMWEGPPFIHSRMQERLRCGCLAASSAKASIQPDAEVATTPAAANLNHSRRDRRGVSLRIIVNSPLNCRLMIVDCRFGIADVDHRSAIDNHPSLVVQVKLAGVE